MKRVLVLLVILAACQKSNDKKVDQNATSAKVADPARQRPKTPQVDPPLDIKNPPADAVKTPSGLVYKTLAPNPQGQAPKKNDTVMIKYTGWRQSSGETFFSNQSADNAMPLNLATTAPGFTEA